MQTNKLIAWLNKQKRINKLKIKKKSYQNLKQWKFDENLIYHKTKNFFSIKPFLCTQGNVTWFQPLIIQKEQGILGIIKKKIKMQFISETGINIKSWISMTKGQKQPA